MVVPDEEIVKGYEYAKGHHVLIDPKEIDELKFEAKHTIDMTRFVGKDEIDIRYREKPYYLVPDGDEADEGYAIMQRALADTRKVALGQLILHGHQHLVGIKALEGAWCFSFCATPMNYVTPNRISKTSTPNRTGKQAG